LLQGDDKMTFEPDHVHLAFLHIDEENNERTLRLELEGFGISKDLKEALKDMKYRRYMKLFEKFAEDVFSDFEDYDFGKENKE